jgi:hypothetical protein
LYAAIIHKYTALAVDRIARRVAEGASAKELAELNEDGFFGYARRMRADLLNARDRTKEFGRGQVNQEIKRQMGGEQ